MMTARQAIHYISEYLYRKFGPDNKKGSPFNVRWSRDRNTFYIYDRRKGRPICYTTVRISDHAPELDNYMDPVKTGFNYPSDQHGYNLSVEFYDPNHRFEYKNNIRNSYNFDVDRYMYAMKHIDKEDLREIITSAMVFMDNPSKGYKDPFRGQGDKAAKMKKGIAFRAQVPFPLPDKSVYDGPMNYWQAVYDPGSRKFESSAGGTLTYMFVTFEKGVDIVLEAQTLVMMEKKRREICESVGREIPQIIERALSCLK